MDQRAKVPRAPSAVKAYRNKSALRLVLESVLTASIGGLVAAAIGMLVLDQATIHFSMGVFGLAIGPGVLALGLLAGLVLGVLGAFVPAIRCLRLPVPEALRAA